MRQIKIIKIFQNSLFTAQRKKCKLELLKIRISFAICRTGQADLNAESINAVSLKFKQK